MAVVWTPFADQVLLSTLRGSINTFNSAVAINIDSVETSITGLTSGKISKSEVGILFLLGSASVPAVSLTTSYQKVRTVDTTSIDANNGHITINYGTDSITVNTTGIYKIRFSGSMTANNGAIVTFNYNVNSSSLITHPPEFLGRGSTSPVSVENSVVMQLTAGSVVYIEAKADSAITMTPDGCGMSIEKTHY